jgi:hypothetical protein
MARCTLLIPILGVLVGRSAACEQLNAMHSSVHGLPTESRRDCPQHSECVDVLHIEGLAHVRDEHAPLPHASQPCGVGIGNSIIGTTGQASGVWRRSGDGAGRERKLKNEILGTGTGIRALLPDFWKCAQGRVMQGRLGV